MRRPKYLSKRRAKRARRLIERTEIQKEADRLDAEWRERVRRDSPPDAYRKSYGRYLRKALD